MSSIANSSRDSLQPVCQNCTTSTTPLWRRDEIGSVLCNACGLFLKLHGRPRPISLKTDVIKSRNRVKSSSQGPKKRSLFETNGLSSSRSDAGTPPPGSIGQRRTSGKTSSGASNGSTSPLSRTGTPGIPHGSIGSHAVFDGVALSDHSFRPSSGLPSLHLGRQSPSDRHREPHQSYDALAAANTVLKTRVSELEVINNLFRDRVAELEHQVSVQRGDLARHDIEDQLRRALDDSQRRESDLKRRLDDFELEAADLRDSGPRNKKMRVSDIVDDSGISTPQSTNS
ncbi:MAG: hypothetical protein M1833_000525 [Piccolia ochrophora]|nr:MAG: hypothetical protein M1833_000525 [Piccolia ochrophora]